MTNGSASRRWRFYRSEEQAPDELPVAREEFNALPDDAVTALTESMQRYRAGASRPNEVKSLGDGLIELRVQLGTNPYRLLFFHDGPVCLAVLAVYKNQRRLPQPHLTKAKRRMRSWQDRARAN